VTKLAICSVRRGSQQDSPDEGSQGENGIVERHGENEPFQMRWEMTACSKQNVRIERNGRSICDVRRAVMAYQPPAAISPPRTSWQNEISKAPRRRGKQHKKWRATMPGFDRSGGRVDLWIDGSGRKRRGWPEPGRRKGRAYKPTITPHGSRHGSAIRSPIRGFGGLRTVHRPRPALPARACLRRRRLSHPHPLHFCGQRNQY
jgi:hypothetical protein